MLIPFRKPVRVFRIHKPCQMGSSIVLLLLSILPFLCMATVPVDLTNFQDEYPCDNTTVRIVRPTTLADVQDAVRRHSRVQGVGEGHSWNQPFFCANTNLTGTDGANSSTCSGSVNIVMTTIRPLTIVVDEENLAVDVDAGVKTIDLLQFLGNYVTRKAPAGYTLPAFPWFVYQSIGGAVSTGTHGSSLTWGSLSNQLLSITLVLANGTLHTFSRKSDPFLMRAVRVSVGQLGVITSLRLRLVKEEPVQRQLNLMPSSGFLGLLTLAQQQYRENKTLPSWLNETEFFWITQRSEFMMVSFTRGDVLEPDTRHEVIASFTSPDNTTVYNTSEPLRQEPNVTYLNQLPLLNGPIFGSDGLGHQSSYVVKSLLSIINQAPPGEVQSFVGNPDTAAGTINSTSSQSPPSPPRFRSAHQRLAEKQAAHANAGRSGDGTQQCSALQWDIPPPQPETAIYANPGLASVYMDISRSGVLSIANNATLESHESYLYQPAALSNNIRRVLYDQYEVAIPVSHMADCFKGLLDLVYQGDIDGLNETLRAQDKGLRTAPLIRLLGQEDGLLSYAGDIPRIFLNIEDYVFYNSGRHTNKAFKAMVGYLRSSPSCGAGGLNGTGARLHWGKAGWPDPGCWHGDVEYPETWCDFGCAKKALDPDGKFTDSAPDRWTWEGVDLALCCGDQGFLKDKEGCKCVVKHHRTLDSCPPAPYYTNR